MMKKLLTVLLALVLAFSLLTACGGSDADDADTPDAGTTAGDTADTADDADASDDEQAPLLGEDGVFTVGFDQEFPPFGYVGEDGEFTGLDLEMARELASRLGWEIALQPIDWDAKDFELESGTIDCIWNGFTINGREDLYTWSVPYYDNTQVFIVTAASGITDFAGLAGKTVEVQKDSSALAALNDNADLTASFGELIEIADYNTAFMDLEMGTCDAVAIDAGVANFQIAGKEEDFVILEEAISTEQYGIGFLLGNEALRDAVEAEFLAMAEDGTVEDIVAQFPDIDITNICIVE